MSNAQFTTESGSHYLIEWEGDEQYLTRLAAGGGNKLRRDSEAVRIIDCTMLELGQPMVFALDLVGDGTVTTRCTTPVTWYSAFRDDGSVAVSKA